MLAQNIVAWNWQYFTIVYYLPIHIYGLVILVIHRFRGGKRFGRRLVSCSLFINAFMLFINGNTQRISILLGKA
ncbi:hypothetical protein Avbf_16165 [Armadillidium vulgare]|nr:hypothetical protein Avbf_16165 [Armadillidium vulgare]